MANKGSETADAARSTICSTEGVAEAAPSAKTLEGVETELRRRYKKRRMNASDGVEDQNCATEVTVASNVTNGEGASHMRTLNRADGNREQNVAADGEQNDENDGEERKDDPGDEFDSSNQCRRRQKRDCDKRVKHCLVHDSGSSARGEECGESQTGNNGKDENKGREDRRLPNKYREEYRMCYRNLVRERKTYVPEAPRRKGRTKRTLTGKRAIRVMPRVNDSIWRVQYEIGCLPGGSNEFVAPRRVDYDVCESLDRAGYVGMGLLAQKLGYDVKEMKSLGGYGIEKETEKTLELYWSPPGSEYCRVILTKLCSKCGLWMVDVECGMDYEEGGCYELPSWKMLGPFENLENAVSEAKLQMGGKRGWGWEEVALDGGFEIMMDNESGWEGIWNKEGEYCRVCVKMIGWPETRIESICSCKYGLWRKAFGLDRGDDSKGMAVRVEWQDSS